MSIVTSVLKVSVFTSNIRSLFSMNWLKISSLFVRGPIEIRVATKYLVDLHQIRFPPFSAACACLVRNIPYFFGMKKISRKFRMCNKISEVDDNFCATFFLSSKLRNWNIFLKILDFESKSFKNIFLTIQKHLHFVTEDLNTKWTTTTDCKMCFYVSKVVQKLLFNA